MTRDYRIEVRSSDEDGAWLADVPDLAFCTAHGPTPEHAVSEARVAIEAWLGAARAEGRAIPPPSRSATPA